MLVLVEYAADASQTKGGARPMILLLVYSGISSFLYSIQYAVGYALQYRALTAVAVILLLEAAAVLLGLVLGALAPGGKKSRIGLSVPALVICLRLICLRMMGTLGEEHMLLPFLLEDALVFSAVSCMVLYMKKRRGQ